MSAEFTKKTTELDPLSMLEISSLVETYRNPERPFFSFPLLDKLELLDSDGCNYPFYFGDGITHYSLEAKFLATVNSSKYSIQVEHGGQAIVTERNLAHPSVFNTWFQTALRAPYSRDRRPGRS